jgi:hypothetical protein
MFQRSTAIRLALTIAAILSLAESGFAQVDELTPAYTDLFARLDAQEAELRELRAQISGDASSRMVDAGFGAPTACARPPVRRLPVVVEPPVDCACSLSSGDAAGGEASKNYTIQYVCDYDEGLLLRPIDPQKTPFELKVNGWIQFRQHVFDRDVDSWTDNAGITRSVRDRNIWEVERGRLVFSGYALDERLTYFLQLDGDTDGAESVDFFDYWWAWAFSDRFEVQLGKRKVPGSRQWLLGARDTRLVDRPMACDFFRPDRTTGVFGVGRIGQTGHYEIMVGNGYRTANLTPSQCDDRFAFAATNYWDPLGDFGRQLVDYDCTLNSLVRIGHSFVYSSQEAVLDGIIVDEPDFMRISDGTQLIDANALAPGFNVSQFDIYLYAIDAAWKWRGWSLDAEAYLQWVEDIRGNGPPPFRDLFQKGFFVEGGVFLVPRKLDVNVRYSQVSGLFGNAAEYAAGFNWYPLDTSKMKISFDVTSVESSPVQSTSADILVGDDGMLYRTQVQAEF